MIVHKILDLTKSMKLLFYKNNVNLKKLLFNLHIKKKDTQILKSIIFEKFC